MPNRIIKESVCTSDSIEKLSWFEEVVFYRLIVNCDDFGRLDARAAILRSRLFPLKSVTDKQITDALKSLRTAGIVDLYEVDGKPYLQLRTWERHQTIRAKKSKFPAPCEQLQADEINCMQLQADASKCSRNPIQSESESKSNPKESGDKPHPFHPPTIEEVQAYCTARGNDLDPARFIDFYASKGWLVGKAKMKDWKACVRTWESRNKNRSFVYDDHYEEGESL